MTKSYLSLLGETETHCVQSMLDTIQWSNSDAAAIEQVSVEYIERIRKTRRKTGSLESFFEQYGLNTQEGLALMALSEALLRIPDSETANALIRDKVSGTDWLKNIGDKKDWMTRAAGLGLKITSGTMNSLFSKMGQPVIREAMMRAMQMMGQQFVIGEDLKDAAKTAIKLEEQGYRLSYDVLGEGARTMEDAQRYFNGYRETLQGLIASMPEQDFEKQKPGISVKLSALHPRFEYAQKAICVPYLIDKIFQLCIMAASAGVTLTVDAEEVSRLSITLDVVEGVCEKLSHERGINEWPGFGLAVQAYQKCALDVIDHILVLSKKYKRKIQVRLVKGAYWDSEIKHAQELGLSGFPVYTRKTNTDVSYILCAQKMLNNREHLYPMFGTHNAHTVASILHFAGMGDQKIKGYEFQKLYGMGDALYAQVKEDHSVLVTSYAPIGNYADLLPYLVRRMLENGANSSFVNKLYNKEFAPEAIAIDPVKQSRENALKSHPNIKMPSHLFGDKRLNSKGIDLSNENEVEKLLADIAKFNDRKYDAFPLIESTIHKTNQVEKVYSPIDTNMHLGGVHFTTTDLIDKAFASAKQGHALWSKISVTDRAAVMTKLAIRLEQNTAELAGLLIREGGKTIPDAIGEVREAVDFCRYYARRGILDFAEEGMILPSPTGEENIYKMQSRGVFVCISPWNFPLAIFLGQITAALMAGNSVIAKPAEQTSLIGMLAIRLLFQAGLPPNVITYLPGDGNIGAALVDHKDVAGVAFTGSTDVAKSIQGTLANNKGPIVPLIAETGGQNAIIADSSALTEQLVDDVILSAFGSAGQRCSAARILFIQDDVADKTIKMLRGAMALLKIGHPAQLSTDIGPVIDMEAKAALQHHKTRLKGFGKEIETVALEETLSNEGTYFAPIAYEIDSIEHLEKEVFGPVLHVVRYKAGDIDAVIDQINALGYGLTFGVHSRIQSFIDKVTRRVRAGNVYVNRGIIGAVVGAQPFGGQGLSGTGPKAGGPRYLHAFGVEQVISTDTTAAGGNASLVMLDE